MSDDAETKIRKQYAQVGVEIPDEWVEWLCEPVDALMPTNTLRWSRSGKLQQMWEYPGSNVIEWRDVPTEGRNE